MSPRRGGACGPAIVPQLAARLERFAAGARIDPADAEGAHRARVTARRLHAALVVWRPLLALPPAVRPAVLREVERRLGALRDLDVLQGHLIPVLETLPALRQRLGEARAAALALARRAVARGSLRRTLEGVERWVAEPTFHPLASLPPWRVGPALVAPALTRVLLAPGWLVEGQPDPLDPRAAPLHALRRRVKRLRYRLECLEPWGGAELAAWLEELHAMQDALGDWHDAGVLLEWLGEPSDGEDLLAAARRRATAALAPWPAWRARWQSRAGQAAVWRRLAALGAPPRRRRHPALTGIA